MKLKLNTKIYGAMHSLLNQTCSLNIALCKEIKLLKAQRAAEIDDYNAHVDTLDLPTIVGEFELDILAVMAKSTNFKALSEMGLVDGDADEVPLVTKQENALGVIVSNDDDEYCQLPNLNAMMCAILTGKLMPNSDAETLFCSMVGEHNELRSQLTFSLGLGFYTSEVLHSNMDVARSEVRITQTFSIERLGTMYGLLMMYNDHRLKLAYLDTNIDRLKSVSETLDNYNSAVVVIPDAEDTNPAAF